MRSFLLVAFLTLAQPLNAQHKDSTRAFKATGAFYALSVEDLDAAVDWYTLHLDFIEVSRAENEQRGGALLTRGGTLLEIAAFVDGQSRNDLQEGLESHQVFGLFKLGFVVDDLDAAFEDLSLGGAEIFFSVVDAGDGRRTFGIKDPDGNIIQFFGD